MKLLANLRATTKALVTGASAVALVASFVSAGGGAALAGGGSPNPAWEPDPNSATPQGNVVFYNASGNVVTSGSNLSHLFDYAAATTGPDTGATKATLFFAAPNHSLPTINWVANQQSGSTNFPNSSAPAPITGPGFANPVATLTSTNADLNAALGVFTLDTTAGYANIIQVRLKDSGTGGAGSGTNYWSTDIAYNNGSTGITVDGVTVAPGSWAQLYPNYTTTSVSLAAVPTSPETASGCPPVGANVTLTATITPSPTGTVTGTVQFFDGTTPLGSPMAVSGNSAVGALTSPSVGTHMLSAVFTPTGGTEVQGSSSATQSYVVNPPSSGLTTTTTLMASSASVPYSAPVMLTSHVASSDSSAMGVAGSVQFFDGTTSLGTSNTTVSGTTGTATLSPSALPVGAHSLTATFTPTNNCYSPSTSSPATSVTVVPASTTTAVTSSPPSGTVTGQAISFTATVTSQTPATATPVGSVQFKDGTTSICTPVTLNSSGVATCSEQPSTAGPHSITAAFTPANGNFSASDNTTSPLIQSVGPDSTTTVVTSLPNPSNTGSSVTYTGTVTAYAPGGGTPAGAIEFKDGSSDIAGCLLVSMTAGAANCTPTPNYSVPGAHSITAIYHNSDGNYSTSTSAALIQHVVTPTSTTLQTPTGSIVDGAPATFSATVSPTPDTGPGSGTVDFFDGSTKICSASSVDSSGIGSCTAPILGAGNHTITATYSGDSLYGASTAAGVTQAVTADSTTVTVTSSPATVVTGQKVNYTATVSADPPGSGFPAGYVEFQDSGTDISGCAHVNLSGGQAVCDPVYGAPGAHSISAIYHNADGNYVGSSTAAALAVMIKQATGYWMVGSDGGVFTFGGAGFFGSLGAQRLNAPIKGMTLTHDRAGYWLVGADGGVFTFGDAIYHGSLGGQHLNAPIVGIVPTLDGGGYWLVGADGGVFTFGDAVFYGSMGATHLNAPVVAIVATPSGHGYWLVAKDGGVFTFGDAVFYGSTGATHLNAPIVGMVATSSGHGYYLVAKDGGVFTFGDAVFYGSTGATHLNAPVIGIAATTSGGGYRLFASDGGVFDFGDATYQGSLAGGGVRLNAPIDGGVS